MTARWRRAALVAAGAVTVVSLSVPSAAADGKSWVAGVRQATVPFHDLTAAQDAGYEQFLPCFDSPDGGMGQHFANFTLLADPAVDAAAPEVLVYEPRADGYKLVAVEYVVLGADAATAPTLNGEEFHFNPDLNVWALHVWLWRGNPAGTFADFNATVRDCP